MIAFQRTLQAVQQPWPRGDGLGHVMVPWLAPFSPPHFSISACLWTWLSVLEGSRADGEDTHTPNMWVMMRKECVLRLDTAFLPPLRDYMATTSSLLMFRCPDSPLNLYYPTKPSYVVISNLTEIALCGLTLIAAMHISESVCMPAQAMHLPALFRLKLLSDNLFVFFNTDLSGLMWTCTAEPGLENLPSARICWLGMQLSFQKVGALQPCPIAL